MVQARGEQKKQNLLSIRTCKDMQEKRKKIRLIIFVRASNSTSGVYMFTPMDIYPWIYSLCVPFDAIVLVLNIFNLFAADLENAKSDYTSVRANGSHDMRQEMTWHVNLKKHEEKLFVWLWKTDQPDTGV